MDEFERMARNGCLYLLLMACIVAFAIYGIICLIRNLL